MKIRLDVINENNNAIVHRELMDWPDDESWAIGYSAAPINLTGTMKPHLIIFTRVF